MKTFLLKLSFFLSLVFTFIAYVVFNIDGSFDPYYVRFTTGQKQSLIIGASRTAQGIKPEVLNTKLQGHQFFNFAFNGNISPYGPTYLNAIKKKLNPKTTNGIFILSVGPGHFSSKHHIKDDSLRFIELNNYLAKTRFVNLKPNIFYLLDNYSNFIRTYFTDRNRESRFLHDNGWLEAKTNFTQKQLEKRHRNVLRQMKSQRNKYQFSNTRWQYFLKTIQFLKNHGEVYLVRLPVERKVGEIENNFWPEYDSLISDISSKYNTPYLNMTLNENDYIFIDGSHLHQESAPEVSRLIGDWIFDNENKTSDHGPL